MVKGGKRKSRNPKPVESIVQTDVSVLSEATENEDLERTLSDLQEKIKLAKKRSEDNKRRSDLLQQIALARDELKRIEDGEETGVEAKSGPDKASSLNAATTDEATSEVNAKFL